MNCVCNKPIYGSDSPCCYQCSCGETVHVETTDEEVVNSGFCSSCYKGYLRDKEEMAAYLKDFNS